MVTLRGLLTGGNSDDDSGSSTVFIASTLEAIESPWLNKSLLYSEENLGRKVTLLPWTQAFRPGDMTGEKLIAYAQKIGAAVVVLTGDDETQSRGDEGQPSPRDNLIFEAAIFLSQLGLGRVLLLREEGAKMPSDLLGVTLPSFKGPDENGHMSEFAIKDLSLQISDFLEGATEDTELEEDNPVTRAIKTTLERVEASIADVRGAIGPRPGRKDAVDLPDATNAYLDGVREVQGSFMTTTYLDSKFWTSNEISAVEANECLIERLKEGGTARRLIVLDRPIEAELKFQRELRRLLRSKQSGHVEEMDQEFNAFYSDNARLVEEGFEVKVVFDHDAAYKKLPREMNFKEGEDELALFDDERIDIYSGFAKSRSLPSARMFTNGTDRFKVIQDMTSDYFVSLWESQRAVDFLEFGEKLNAIIEESRDEIDYEPNWLLRYDNDADDGDAQLKREELNWVLNALKRKVGGGGSIRHLDLGTCTGRYIRELRTGLDVTLSVGIDLDRDCLEHCMRLRSMLGNPDDLLIHNADIREADTLPNGRFDVVTCMMGTLCHLRRGPKDGDGKFVDSWQSGLDNLAAHLVGDGDAFVALWNRDDSDDGSRRALLSIYPERTNEILLRLSPPLDEFHERLEQAGLRSVAHALVGRQLDVFHLQNI
jgi:hypothetical protein